MRPCSCWKRKISEIVTPDNTWFSDILAGLVVGFIQVMVALSLASLIFSGPLLPDLPRGITIFLMGTAIHVLFRTCFGSYYGVMNTSQDNPAVLMAVATASIGAMNLGVTLLPTIIALMMVTTLLTGGFLVLLGRFKLGGLVRYIPYPVIGGFLAGTGWLMVQGSISAMTPYKLIPTNLPLLFTLDQMILWLPGIVFGAVLYAGVRRIKHRLTLPGLLFSGLAVFYIVLIVTGTSIAAATQGGLLLGSVGNSAVWQPLPLGDLAQADWGVVLGQAGSIGAILALTAITLLLNVSALELGLRRDVDLNHELQVVGFSNLLSGLAGGMIGYYSITQTMLRQRMGSRARLAGLVAGGISVTLLVAGTSVLAYIPKFLLGGLLIFLGLGFLDEWVVKTRKTLSCIDYAVVLSILVIIAVSGFLVGVGIGLVLMTGLFVLNYSRLPLFHRLASGSEVTSHVARSVYHQRMLTKLGARLHVLELQGYIFFGTANVVLEHIRQRITQPIEKPQFLILDFRRVTGLDSSAAFSFVKAQRLAEVNICTLVFTNLSPAARHDLIRGGLKEDDQVVFFTDLDHGLEWCENQLLERERVTKTHLPATLTLQLGDSGFKPKETQRLKSFMEQSRFAPGDYLLRQGQVAGELFFIEIGQVSVCLEMEDNRQVRLQTFGMGTIVGELGFFLNVPRSASVIADLNTIAYSLKREALETMTETDPALAAAFHALMVRMLSERLVAATGELATLNR